MSPATRSRLTVGRAVDWQFAATVGAKLARRGPAATDYTRNQVIDQLAEAARNAELPAPSGSVKISFRVKPGDTLAAIATQFGTSIQALQTWNGIRGSRIVAGDSLTVYATRGF